MIHIHPEARILIAGQAPGVRVHATGVPFDDPSGDRLRAWMGVSDETFCGKDVAILPMGFCFPGTGKSGDLPPQPRCAQTWRAQLLNMLSEIRLTLVIGRYAQDWHLPQKTRTLTETVRNWAAMDPSIVPLPHPSPRNNIWLRKNPWFEEELIPTLRERVKSAVAP